MTEIEKLRALLTDARDYIVAPCGHGDYYIIQRINAALAESPSDDMRPDVVKQRQVRGK